MEALHDAGRARLLGVSNVSLDQLATLHAAGAREARVRAEPLLRRAGWDREVRAFCAANGIVYQGFSLLTANPRRAALRPVAGSPAARSAARPAQVVFRFALRGRHAAADRHDERRAHARGPRLPRLRADGRRGARDRARGGLSRAPSARRRGRRGRGGGGGAGARDAWLATITQRPSRFSSVSVNASSAENGFPAEVPATVVMPSTSAVSPYRRTRMPLLRKISYRGSPFRTSSRVAAREVTSPLPFVSVKPSPRNASRNFRSPRSNAAHPACSASSTSLSAAPCGDAGGTTDSMTIPASTNARMYSPPAPRPRPFESAMLHAPPR